MSFEITKSHTKELNALHAEILGDAKSTLDKAIQLGGMLVKTKDAVPHGKWEEWVETNLDYTPRTALNYMKCWASRTVIRAEKVVELKEAYRLISAPPPTPQPPKNKQIAQQSDQIGNQFPICDTPEKPHISQPTAGNAPRETKPKVEPPSTAPRKPAESGKPLHMLAIWTEIEGLYGKALNRIDELNRICSNPRAHGDLIKATKSCMLELAEWREGFKKR